MKEYFEENIKSIVYACRRTKEQSAQIIVLTALMLPLLLAAAGLAIDFGNLYVHKAKLQNISDASAVAAAHAYVNYDSKTSMHISALGDAEEAGQKSCDFNRGSSDVNVAIYHDPDEGYLKVVAEEKGVPLYFLPYFGIQNNTTVSAVSYVSAGKQTVAEAISKLGSTFYTSSGGVNAAFGNVTGSGSCDKISEITEICKAIENNEIFKVIKPDNNAYFVEYKILPEDSSDPCNVVLETNASNSGNVKTLYLPNAKSVVNNVPAILIYKGTGQLNINVRDGGHVFKGIIYAPNAKVFVEKKDTPKVDFFKFYGTIIANYVDLKMGIYTFESILDTGSGGSGSGTGGSTTTTKTNGIALTSPSKLPEGINFRQ